MSRIHIATDGLEDWQSRLASPRHWKRKRSAFEAAVSWESSQRNKSGLPQGISEAIGKVEELGDPDLVVALVEHRVGLPHGGRPSQNDVWALVDTAGGMLSLAVEAKAGEDFDVPVAEWLARKAEGSRKDLRLEAILAAIGVAGDVSAIRYQLLHRTASAVLEAKRWHANFAAMIVQSFDNPELARQQSEQWEDFRRFCSLFEIEAEKNRLVLAKCNTEVPLYVGWVSQAPATDDEVARLTRAPRAEEVRYEVLDEKVGSLDPESPGYSGTYTPPAPYHVRGRRKQ